MAIPEQGTIEVFSFRIDEENGIPMSLAKTVLSPDEVNRANAFRFPVHQGRYIRGRAAMRFFLASALGQAADSFRFSFEERGKPYLKDSRVHFNLSHSENFAVFAVSQLSAIGVDVERFDRDVKIDALSKRCFRESELKHFSGLGIEQRRRLFFALWTAKEARMKSTGEGFQLEPQQIELEIQNSEPLRYLAPATPSAFLQTLSSGRETACSVAALEPFSVSHIQVSGSEWDQFA